eukprot:Skav217110  [mRNA]  locus=scaffold1627:189603:194675:- [translate_table: standard]
MEALPGDEYRTIPLVRNGPCMGLPVFEPQWNQLVDDNRVTCRARVIIFNDGSQGIHRCISEIQHKPFMLQAQLTEKVEHIAILHGVFKRDHRGAVVQMGFASEVLQLGQTSASSFFRMKELCAGIGGLSQGCKYAGIRTTALVEKQPKFCAMHPKNGNPAIIEGDINRLSTLSRLFRAAPEVDSLGLGFSCQPFSKGGDRRGGYDTRAYTLAWGLFCAYILKAPLIILECVSEAPDHQYVRQCIHAFQQCTGFHSSERILDINGIWPSSRKRWWCVLTHTTVGKVPLSPMPRLPQAPIVSDLIPDFWTPEEAELSVLILQPSEKELLQRIGADLSKCEAPLHGVMPTALHSWGNQLGPCACECRPSALSTQRLLDRGFFGTLIKQRTEEGGFIFRHPAPAEVALMVGMNLKATVSNDPRLELAALGQIASPLQSSWIAGIVKDHVLAQGFGVGPRELVHAPLARLVQSLFEQRNSMFPSDQHSTMMQRFESNLKTLLAVPEVEGAQQPNNDVTMPSTTDFVWPNPSGNQGTEQSAASTAIAGAVPGFQWTPTLPVSTSHDDSRTDAPATASQDSDTLFEHGLRNESKWKEAEISTNVEGGNQEGTAVDTSHHPQSAHQNAPPTTDEMRAGEPIPADGKPDVTPLASPEARDDQDQTMLPDATTAEDESVQDAPEGKPNAASLASPEGVEGDVVIPPPDGKPDAATLASPEGVRQEDGATDTNDEMCEAPTTPHSSSDDRTLDMPMDSPDGKPDAATLASPEGAASIDGSGTTDVPPQMAASQTQVDVEMMTAQDDEPLNADDASIQSLIQAEFPTQHAQIRAFSIVGTPIDMIDLVANWQVVVLQHELDVVQQYYNSMDCVVSEQSRVRSLLFQGSQVAHDEMAYYLQALAMNTSCQIIQPLVAQQMFDPAIDFAHWFQGFQAEEVEAPVISAILANGHWSPILRTPDGLVHSTCEGQQFLQSMGMEVCTSHDMQVCFDHDCGFQTFSWLAYHLGCSRHYVMPCDAAASWRFLCWQHFALQPEKNTGSFAFLGGHADELQTALATLLREHGVPAQLVMNRAEQVITKLGKDRLVEAMQAKRPWAQIKHLANLHSPKIQLVLPTELQQILKQRTTSNQSVGSKDNKSKAPSKVLQPVQASDISIPPGVFVYPDGSPVRQIELRQIQAEGKGLVVCGEADVQPFLQKDPISKEGLVFLILNPSQQMQDQQGGAIRVPAQCRSTGEPMLVSVVLLQAGMVVIKRNIPHVLSTVPEVQVCTLKVFMYRDQIANWTELTQAPVKYMLSQLPWLSSCRRRDCKCPAWHRDQAPDDGPTSVEPLLDIWGRDFLSPSFRRVRPQEAEMFVCSCRLRGDLLHKVLHLSGQNGLYFEPRSDDGKGPHEGYLTVWLQKLEFTEACAATAKATRPTSLIRVAKRYGLKVAKADAQTIHQQFRGDAPFLGNGQATVYQLGPLPWGTSRQGLQKLFSQWGWPAVPLQPAGKSACQKGLVWWARATTPPSHSVVTMSHGDIIIVKRDAEVIAKPQVPRVEASSRTRSSLSGQTQVTQLLEDPWAAAASHLPRAQAITQSHLEQLEARLEQKIAQMPDQADAPMDGSWEPRVKQLEEQMAALASAQHQQAAQTQSLKNQIDAQSKAFQHHLDSSLSQQMERIDQLLEKRLKRE